MATSCLNIRCQTADFGLLPSDALRLRLSPEYLGKLIIRHVSYPAFADGDGHVGEGSFLLDDLIDLFFEGVLGDETVDEDVVLLADAVGAVCRLRLYGGIPPKVVVDDMGGGGEVEAGAGGFQGEDEESRLRVGLEAVHHVFSLPEGAAAVEEHRTFSQFAFEEICQLIAHALELGEDQGLFTAGLNAFCEIEEALSFAGEGGVPVILFGEEGGMVADLLQGEDHLQDETLAFEEGVFVSVLLLADDAEALFDGLVIQGGLRGGEEGILVLLELIRKVADDGLVCLEAAQEHGRSDAFEAFGCFSVLLVLDGIRIACLEGLRTAEVAFVCKFHDGPEFFEAVLDGGAGDGDADGRFHAADGPTLGGIGVLDVLRFVDDEDFPFLLFEKLLVTSKESIGGEKDVPMEISEVALATIVEENGEERCKAGDLFLPIGEKARRHDDERFLLGKASLFAELFEEGDDLKGLPKAHIIGQDAAEAEAAVVVKPRIAALLVGAKCRTYIFRQRDGLALFQGGEQSLHLARHGDLRAFIAALKGDAEELFPLEGERMLPHFFELFQICFGHVEVLSLEGDERACFDG